MSYKAPFCSFYALFCTFLVLRSSKGAKHGCASLRLKRTVFARPKTSMISVNPVILSDIFRVLRMLRGEITPEISVNSWLINDLRSTKVYVRNYKLFLQNEPKFRKVKLNVNKVLTRNYDQMDTWSIRITKPIKANKSQLKPIKPNLSCRSLWRSRIKPKLKKAKMNVTSYITKGYENKSNWAICENEPKQTQFKSNL
jgi:hypothetical protein